MPLTSSLYVKGSLADREKVIVDVGTGFYVEKVMCLYWAGLMGKEEGVPRLHDANISRRNRLLRKQSNFITIKLKSWATI